MVSTCLQSVQIFVSLSPPTLLNPTLLNPEEWKMLGGMEWWDKVKIPMRLIWIGVAKRLGIRKNGTVTNRHSTLSPIINGLRFFLLRLGEILDM